MISLITYDITDPKRPKKAMDSRLHGNDDAIYIIWISTSIKLIQKISLC
jgi:hypothetical protein